MEKHLKLLLIEDNDDDAALLQHHLEREGFVVFLDRIDNGQDMQERLKNHLYDLIICDFRLPKFSGEHALEIFKSSELDIPFILVSGTIGEEVAVGMMKAGAHDYIMKDQLRKIGPAVTRELREASIRQHRRQTIEELKLAKEKAEQSDHLKSTLLSNMSHEFRTPLTGILGFAQVIENNSDDQDTRDCAKKIFKSGMRLMKTLDSIVWLSQLESGIHPSIREFDIHRALQQVYLKFEEFVEYKHLQCICHFDGYCPVVSDEELVARAFSAILDNAIKYTREGRVEVATRRWYVGDKEMLDISVADTGIGITSEHLTSIFDAFRQVSEGFSRHYEGIGLGLTIARKIMRLLDGDVHVESRPGHGSVFTLRLPVGERVGKPVIAGQPEGVAASPVPEVKAAIPRVLIVEDNETNAELVRLYLRSRCETTHAASGPEAIDLCKVSQFDFIMLDINLGQGMSGTDVVKELRQIPGYESVPVIAMTGYTQYGDRARLLQQGCSHYLAKPFTRDQLLAVINLLG